MTTTISLENPSIELLKAFKSMAKAANVKLKVRQNAKPSWLKEAKDMSENPHKYKAYSDVGEMFADILR